MADREITGLTADSRAVQPGYLFAALPSSTDGGPLNGADFIPDALARGAAALLGPPGLEAALAADVDVPIIEDEDPRRRLSFMAARFFGAQPDAIAAVTGTSGKSSVVDFLRQIWTALGRQGASLGTLGVISPSQRRKLDHTTPDPVVLHQALAELAKAGVGHLALEASSHGLEQRRLDAVKLRAAAFTNLSRDHLDYHSDEEAYFKAKLRLFETVMAPGGTAVLPGRSEFTDRLRASAVTAGHKIMTFGGGDVNLLDHQALPDGQRLTIAAHGARATMELPLIGAFQADNLMCAVALAIACGDGPVDVLDAAMGLIGVPGRLQAVGRGVYVDYAHKPDALRAAIAALRPHTPGKLIVVFGCGGDRDRGKRAQMGRIAADLGDRVVVTDDNPRSEDPAAIRAEIMAACPGAMEIGDRAEAIETAIAWMNDGDVLLIAGKGHEAGQEIAGVVHPFDDAEMAASLLQGGRP